MIPATRARDVHTAKEFDQFYTRAGPAAHVWQVLARRLDLSRHLFVEPSAGEGSFFNLMRLGSIGVDIASDCDGVISADFFHVQIRSDWRIAVVGNPPFGTAGRLAVRFFNRAAEFADVIAMVLPRSFQKASLENCLDSAFVLLHEEAMPRNAFLLVGEPHDVPTVFQIWKRADQPRDLRPAETTHPDFLFSKPRKGCFGIRRIGGKAGLVHDDLGASPSSNYFIRPLREGVRAVMEALDFAGVAAKTTGQKSLAKAEIVALYDDFVRRRTSKR